MCDRFEGFEEVGLSAVEGVVDWVGGECDRDKAEGGCGLEVTFVLTDKDSSSSEVSVGEYVEGVCVVSVVVVVVVVVVCGGQEWIISEGCFVTVYGVGIGM